LSKILKISAILCALFFSFFYTISAGICIISEPSEAFEQAKEVFVGKLTAADSEINSYTFSVEKSWKSIETSEITVSKWTVGGMELIENERYLVYTFDYEGNSVIGKCSRTARIEKSLEDLQFLEGKNTIQLREGVLARSKKIGLTTGVIVLLFLGVGYFFRRGIFIKLKSA
jgi:hypothetical protein